MVERSTRWTNSSSIATDKNYARSHVVLLNYRFSWLHMIECSVSLLHEILVKHVKIVRGTYESMVGFVVVRGVTPLLRFSRHVESPCVRHSIYYAFCDTSEEVSNRLLYGWTVHCLVGVTMNFFLSFFLFLCISLCLSLFLSFILICLLSLSIYLAIFYPPISFSPFLSFSFSLDLPPFSLQTPSLF